MEFCHELDNRVAYYIDQMNNNQSIKYQERAIHQEGFGKATLRTDGRRNKQASKDISPLREYRGTKNTTKTKMSEN